MWDSLQSMCTKSEEMPWWLWGNRSWFHYWRIVELIAIFHTIISKIIFSYLQLSFYWKIKNKRFYWMSGYFLLLLCIMLMFGNNRYFRLYVGPKVEAAIFISIGHRKKLWSWAIPGIPYISERGRRWSQQLVNRLAQRSSHQISEKIR